MAEFPDTISTFRTIENLPQQPYTPTNKTTIYAEDLQHIEEELVAVEEFVLAGGEGVDASTRETINLTERQARGIVRVKYGIFNYIGNGGNASTDMSMTDDGILHVAVTELSDDVVFERMWIRSNAHVVDGPVDVGIYDAYTGNVLKRVTFNINAATTLFQATFGEIVLPTGQYIIVTRATGAYDGSISSLQLPELVDMMSPTGSFPQMLFGTITGYAGATLPDNLDITTIEYSGASELPMIRLG